MAGTAFDPYRQWLDIPAGRRPPTWYALLGLQPGEADQGAIHQAAIERYDRVRNYATGPMAAHAHQLLEEIAEARRCLTDPRKKMEYDRSLLIGEARAALPAIPSPVASPSVVCHNCWRPFAVHAEHAGRRVPCPVCGSVLTIPFSANPVSAAPPGSQASSEGLASSPPAVSAPAPMQPSLRDFLDEELSRARPSGPEKPAAACPICGRPYLAGQRSCLVCEGDPETRSDGWARSPVRLHNRFETGDPMPAFGRASAMLSGWLVKGSTVALVCGVVLFLFVTLSRGVSDAEIEGQVGAIHVSNAHAINANAGWLELHLGRLPGYVAKWEQGASKSESTGNGMWVYTIKGERESWQCAGATLGTAPHQDPLREEQGLAKFWLNRLSSMGYFRSPTMQPDPIVIEEFTIREPAGRTWTLGREGGARQVCNLAVMLGCPSCSFDLTPLMKVKRGSLAYAAFFSAVNQKTALDQKIAMSCDPDADVRLFAAEMLLSTLPHLPLDAESPGVDKQQYESMLQQLARPISADEKSRLHSRLRGQSPVK